MTPAPGWTLIVLDQSAEYRFAAAKWSATGGFISADQIDGDIDYGKLGEIDFGRLLGRAAPDQGNAQQVAVSHGLELTADGDLRVTGATAGSTVRGFYGRDTAGAYGFNDIVPNDIKAGRRRPPPRQRSRNRGSRRGDSDWRRLGQQHPDPERRRRTLSA